MKRHFTFYLEAVLLIAAFLAAVLVLSRSFGVAEAQTRQAGQLTRAVRLAENAAEAFAAAGNPEELLALLDENGNAELREVFPPDTVTAYYAEDGGPNRLGPYQLTVSWQTREDGLTEARIEVRCEREPVYELETAHAAWEVSP